MTHPDCLIHQVKNCISSLKSLYQNKVAFWGPEGRDFNIWIWKGHSNLHYLGWGMVPDIVPASWAELRPQWTPPGSLILSEALTQHFPASPSVRVCVCVCVCVCARTCVLCAVSALSLIMICSGGRDHILVISGPSSQAILCQLKVLSIVGQHFPGLYLK